MGPLERVPTWLAALVLLAGLAWTASPLRTRAAFQPDDYRYLRQLREADAGEEGAFLGGLVVENRWDGDWWIPEGTYVRFWRPLVLPSYALDRALFGEDPRGFTLSNVAWHGLASLLVFLVLARLSGSRGQALFGALLFAVGAARFEHTSYVAGRTDTFAGVAFLATLLAYLRYRRAPSGAGALLVAGAFALALLAKEYCILVPLLFPLADRCVPPESGRAAWRRPALLASLAVVAALYLGLRAAALGEAGSGDRPYPYFHLPGRPGFPEHVAAVLLQDAVLLVVGHVGPAFVQGLGELVATAGAAAVVAGGLAFTALAAWGLARPGPPRFHAVALLGLLAPMLALYSTGRYLYLPSLGWCGLVAAALARLGRLGHAGLLAAALVGGGHLVQQAAMHRAALARLPERPAERGESERVLDLVLEGGSFDPAGPTAYLVDAPLFWLYAQFLDDLLAVETGRRAPVHVLCPRHPGDPPAEVRADGPRSIVVRRPDGPLVGEHPWGDFDPAALEPGRVLEEDGYTAEVLSSTDGRPDAVRFTLPAELGDVQLLQWRTWPPPRGFVRVP